MTTMQWYANGTPACESWMVDGKPHRTDGPSTQQWFPDGTIGIESWEVDGKYHRTDGPAVRQWGNDGSLHIESWYTEGKFHHTDGPAVRQWNISGSLQIESWYIEGKNITEVEFRRMITRKSLQDKILRSSRLLTLGAEVPILSHDTLSVVGGFLE